MADYYTQLSFIYPFSKDKLETANKALSDAIKKYYLLDTSQDDRSIESVTQDEIDDACLGMCDVQDDKDGFWFSAEENCDLDCVAFVIAELQQQLQADRPFHFTWANTCNKLRLDSFDGGGVSVMPDGGTYWGGCGADDIMAMATARSPRVVAPVWTIEDFVMATDMNEEDALEFLKEHKDELKGMIEKAGWEIILREAKEAACR